MAIILRIISADGRRVIEKTLPALPANIKVPVGARVEVEDKDSGVVKSLPRYINEMSDEAYEEKADDTDGPVGPPEVTIESVPDWGMAEAWLETVGQDVEAEPARSTRYYDSPYDDEGTSVMGFDGNTLLIGGLVGGAIGAGALLLTDSDGPSDTVPPVAPSGLALAAEDDTGAEDDDSITTQTEDLTITGTAEAGARVELFEGEESLGTTTADETGNFSFDLDLDEGVHRFTAVATDAAGNVSAPSAVFAMFVDLTPPAAATNLDLAAADDTGASQTDNITSRTTGLTISGSAGANASVELFDGETSLGTVTAGADGRFTLDVSLAPGVHQVTAVVTDVAGNEGEASAPLTITVDTTAPAVPPLPDLAAEDDTGSSNTDNITLQTEDLTIQGTVEPGAFVQVFDNGTAVGNGVAGLNGAYSIDIDLDVGDHTITVRASDEAGNISAFSQPLLIQVFPSAASMMAPQLATVVDTSFSADLIDSDPGLDGAAAFGSFG